MEKKIQVWEIRLNLTGNEFNYILDSRQAHKFMVAGSKEKIKLLIDELIIQGWDTRGFKSCGFLEAWEKKYWDIQRLGIEKPMQQVINSY